MAGKSAKLTKSVIDRYAEALANGTSTSGAAGIVRVHPRTMQGWVSRGMSIWIGDVEASKDVDQLKLLLAVSHARARGTLEERMARTIIDASDHVIDGSWQAALAILERRYRSDWCLKVAAAREEGAEAVLEAARLALDEESYGRLRRHLAQPAIEG